MAKKLAVVAVGGNSLIIDPKKVSVEDQYLAAAETTKHIADMIEDGDEALVRVKTIRPVMKCSAYPW